MLTFWLIFIKNAFFVAFSCFFDHLFSVTVQIQLNMPSDRSNKRDRDHSSRRSEEQDGGRRDRKRSPSRSSRESDNTSRHRHSSPVRKNSSRNLKSSDASKDRSYRNVETDELSFRRSVSRDNERSGAKDRVNSRSPLVSNKLYDSFVGGFVPIDRDRRRIGQEGDALPPLSLSSKRVASSIKDAGMGAPRTHSAPAQVSAPPSGSQAFSDDQIRQLHSLFDSYIQGSSSGMINESHFIDSYLALSTSHTIALHL